MASKQPRKKQPPSKSTAAGRAPARPAAARAQQKQFPVFWIAVGAVVAVAVIAAIVASTGGSDSKSNGGSGGGTSSGHEYGKVVVTGKALPRLPDSGSDPAIGTTIPTVTSEDFSGKPVTIAPGGNAQMIVFLAHWCPHCNREAPKLAEYLRTNGGPPANVGLTIVPTGSSPQAPNWPPSQWVKSMGLGDVATLVDDKAQTAAAAFGLTAYPYIVSVGADGAVVNRRSGEQADGFFARAFSALASGKQFPST
ncbi:MAG: TlpA family protein disulfide reductase [Acidimicrobiia bacterium]